MFTGLVQVVGRVVERRETPAGVRLGVDPAGWSHRPRQEESIAVNGCCLTVAEVGAPEAGSSGGVLGFDVVPQTLRTTSLGRLHPGSKVNLEHAVMPTGLMGGHIVQGHVDGLGRVLRVERAGAEVRVRMQPETGPDGSDGAADAGGAGLMEYIVPKGSITVDGVSLTLAAVEPGDGGAGWFEVALIPTTLERTTLGALAEGQLVNLEVDMIAKTVVHWLRHYGGRPPAPSR